MGITIKEICRLQEKLVNDWHKKDIKNKGEGFFLLVVENHIRNFKLWHVEDKAREIEVKDKIIADAKRAIDPLNQQRNDFIEKIDEFFLNNIIKQSLNKSAEMNSETIGSIIDKLSINSLKIYHMVEELNRKDSLQEYKQKCQIKLKILKEQREDSILCLKKLISDIFSGKKRIKVYRQFKMYNDPESNPILRESLRHKS